MNTRFKSPKLLLSICLAASVGGAQSARADDDFLSLLGGEDAKNEITAPKKSAKKKAEASELRKLVTRGVGTLTAEQNIFLGFLDAGDYEKSLYQWPSAFEGTPFAKTADGRALRALVLFKNNLQVYSLESLLTIDQPAKISASLLKAWNEAAPASHPAWSFVNTDLWKAAWAPALGTETEIRIRGRQTFGADQITVVKDLIKRAPEESRERAWLEWQLVLATALGTSAQDSANAAKMLAVLMKSSENPVSQDLMTLTAARMLYQNGFLDAAIKYYEKVPKASEDWFDAQEELGWAYVRKGEPQNTIAVTQTLAQPEFAAQVGPESIFLRSLALLKVCDYPEVAKTLDLFRDRYRQRAKELMSLATNADTPSVQAFIQKARTSRASIADLKSDASKLPRFLTRDEIANQSVQTQNALENETKMFGELYARSLTGGTAKVGFQAELEDLKKQVERRAQAARSATLNRVKALAEEEINETSAILQKLHIVEAEVIQQVSLAGRVESATAKSKISEKKGTTGYQGPDRLRWPKEDEVWFDELAHYQVDLKKGCQAIKN